MPWRRAGEGVESGTLDLGTQMKFEAIFAARTAGGEPLLNIARNLIRSGKQTLYWRVVF
jgi:hypothetical protein